LLRIYVVRLALIVATMSEGVTSLELTRGIRGRKYRRMPIVGHLRRRISSEVEDGLFFLPVALLLR